MSESSEDVMAWQEKLEAVFDPRSSNDERQILIQDLIKQAPEIRDAVVEAAVTDSVEKILPPKGQSRFEPFVDFIRAGDAVRKQVVKDIIPKVIENPSELPERLADVAQELDPILKRAISSEKLRETLTDPQKVRGAVLSALTEAKKVISQIPEGLESPSFSVLKCTKVYEVRQYEPYPVCSILMEEPSGKAFSEPLSFLKSFDALSRYLSEEVAGGNLQNVTTPVIIDRFADGSLLMSVALPSTCNLGSAPTPTNNKIAIGQFIVDVFAVIEFPGFPTEGEVSRNLQKLEEALVQDGIELACPGAYRLVQYNPSYTLPFFRRNEISVKVQWTGSD